MMYVIRSKDGVYTGEFRRSTDVKKSEMVKLYNIIFGDDKKSTDFKKMKKREIKKYFDYERGQNVVGWTDGDVVIIVVY